MMKRCFSLVTLVACLLLVLVVPARSQVPSACTNGVMVCTGSLGSNGLVYYNSYPDSIATTGNVQSATTTQVIAAVPNQYTFLFWAGVQSSGSNVSLTVNFEYSPVAACASSVTTLLPVGLLLGSPASGAIGTVIGPGNGGQLSITGAGVPFVIPPNNYVCMVTDGTVSVYGIVVYAQHN